MQDRIRVIIVEDDPGLTACLKAELRLSKAIELVATFESFEECARSLKNVSADVILLDIGLPGLDGVRGTAALKKQWPRLRVVILSGNDSGEVIMEAFGAGADGYLLKFDTPRQELCESIEMAHRGGFPMSMRVRGEAIKYYRFRQVLLPRLSPTERQVIDLVEKGMRPKEIAAELSMSINTLKTHFKRINEKSCTASPQQAAFMRRRLSA